MAIYVLTERMLFTHVLVILNKWQDFLLSPARELGLRFYAAVGVCSQRKLSKKYPQIPAIRCEESCEVAIYHS